MQQAIATKREHHDANGTFFLRQETATEVFWNLARYSHSIKDADAVEDIKKNGYMRVSEKGEAHVYVKVSVLLAGSAKEEILKKINAHMGIK
ncbi:hypothetical protein D3C78_1041970 [compost metagenome]